LLKIGQRQDPSDAKPKKRWRDQPDLMHFLRSL
jgi:hypothetical protein